LLGQSWFAEEFRAAGHEVLSLGFAKHLDVKVRVPGLSIRTALEEAGKVFEPDVIVFWDNSAPLAVSGLEEYDVPFLLYSIDTHHHAHLHQYLSIFADETWVAHKDYLQCFKDVNRPASWVPLWASRPAAPAEKKEYGAVFVGTLKRHLNPERVDFFEALQKKTPILVMQGDWVEIFTKSEIVVNQTVKGDLNFRVFEAMMSGAMLLTEKSGNGLYDLFEDKKHLVSYTKNDVDDAAEKINNYLNHQDEMREIARTGREEVVKHHSIEAKAAWFLERIENAQKDQTKRSKNFSLAINYSVLARQVSHLSTEAEAVCLKEVLRLAVNAVNAGEEVNKDVLFNVISSALVFDMYTQVQEGASVIGMLKDIEGETQVVKMVQIRNLLNCGKIEEAKQIAEQIIPGASSELFKEADKAVFSILDERSKILETQNLGIENPATIK